MFWIWILMFCSTENMAWEDKAWIAGGLEIQTLSERGKGGSDLCLDFFGGFVNVNQKARDQTFPVLKIKLLGLDLFQQSKPKTPIMFPYIVICPGWPLLFWAGAGMQIGLKTPLCLRRCHRMELIGICWKIGSIPSRQRKKIYAFAALCGETCCHQQVGVAEIP